MHKKPQLMGCPGCSVSRRGFLAAGCAACAGVAGAMAGPARSARAADKKPRIRVIYSLHDVVQPSPDWPNVGFDFRPVMERINNTLAQGCPNFEFLSSTATGKEQAEKILADDASEDILGYIVYQMNAWNRVIQTIATAEKPTLYADFQFGGSGGFLIYNAGFMREGRKNVGFVSSSDPDDLVAAARCFDIVVNGGAPAEFVAATAKARRAGTPEPASQDCLADSLKTLSTEECLEQLKEKKIIAYRNEEAGKADPIMGIPIDYRPFSELNAAWEAADKDEAKAIADRWQASAADIIDVSRETIENSAAMYLGEKAVMEKHGASAITINCLGGFYGGHIHAYPCLGFYELNNHGLVGACECDLRSTATMVAFSTLTQGRSGYISDPVMDSAKRQIIYAHCVATNRVFGPNGEANPFKIMTHSEDRQGAAVRSIMPTGYMTTSLQVDQGRKEIVMHQGKAMANDPDDRACRTKLCVEPKGDFEKLFTLWDKWGWHRVTFYGDFKEDVMALAGATGFKVVEEA